MGDVRNGLLIHVAVGNGGDSPTGQMVLALDKLYDYLKEHGEYVPEGHDIYEHDLKNAMEHGEVRGQAQGLTHALGIITQYTEQEIRTQLRIRWERRQEEGT